MRDDAAAADDDDDDDDADDNGDDHIAIIYIMPGIINILISHFQ